MFIKEGQFTETQQRILRLLMDGNAHSNEEIGLVIDPDGYCEKPAVAMHIQRIKKRLSPEFMIITEWSRRRGLYRLMRTLKDVE